MALTGSITTDDGVFHQTAYARLGIINIDFVRRKAYIVIYIYKDMAARNDGRKFVGEKEYILTADTTPNFNQGFSVDALEAMSPQRRIYTYLKNQPEWAGWADVVGDSEPDYRP